MRPPSLLVPCGAVVAAVGIHLSIVKVGVDLPGSVLPGASDLVDSIPEQGLGASTDQRLYLLGVVALAVAAWLVPRLTARLKVVGFALAVAATAGAGFAAARGWMIATEGPHALLTDDQSFLERNALKVLDELHASGVLVVHPASGLWVLTGGAVLLVVGVLLTLRNSP